MVLLISVIISVTSRKVISNGLSSMIKESDNSIPVIFKFSVSEESTGEEKAKAHICWSMKDKSKVMSSYNSQMKLTRKRLFNNLSCYQPQCRKINKLKTSPKVKSPKQIVLQNKWLIKNKKNQRRNKVNPKIKKVVKRSKPKFQFIWT